MNAVAIAEYDYTLRDLANGTSLRECLGIAWMDGGARSMEERCCEERRRLLATHQVPPLDPAQARSAPWSRSSSTTTGW